MTRHRYPDRRRMSVAEQLAASARQTADVIAFPSHGDERFPSADIIGLPDDLTPADLADMADTIDCVGVFDSDRRPRGCGDEFGAVGDLIAQAFVEGYLQPGLKP